MEIMVDGCGGWWCCTGCGAFSMLTFVKGKCTKCGGTQEKFYQDGDYK